MYIHNLNPIAFNIGPINIYWYSLAYIISLFLGYHYILYLNQKFKLQLTNKKDLEELFFRAIIGIIIGGRLGYAIFYNTPYYLSNPHEILFLWQGGMSFHGGMIGVTLATLYHCHKAKKKFFDYIDIISCAVPIGLFLGRVANFINGELYGKISNVKWAVIFPNAGLLPRHPTQLYEALLEGLLTFIIMYIGLAKFNINKSPGKLCGLFLIIYSSSRIFIEFYRLADLQIGYFFNIITLGQILSLPMFLLGIYLLIFYGRKK
jgi:phosphatidylglycerol:prolipoprotein diacylglycerol transferase